MFHISLRIELTMTITVNKQQILRVLQLLLQQNHHPPVQLLKLAMAKKSKQLNNIVCFYLIYLAFLFTFVYISTNDYFFVCIFTSPITVLLKSSEARFFSKNYFCVLE